MYIWQECVGVQGVRVYAGFIGGLVVFYELEEKNSTTYFTNTG